MGSNAGGYPFGLRRMLHKETLRITDFQHSARRRSQTHRPRIFHSTGRIKDCSAHTHTHTNIDNCTWEKSKCDLHRSFYDPTWTYTKGTISDVLHQGEATLEGIPNRTCITHMSLWCIESEVCPPLCSALVREAGVYVLTPPCTGQCRQCRRQTILLYAPKTRAKCKCASFLHCSWSPWSSPAPYCIWCTRTAPL